MSSNNSSVIIYPGEFRRDIEDQIAILRDNPQLLYKPEDVYARCLYGESSLLLVDKGFIIVTITEDEVRNIKIFYK